MQQTRSMASEEVSHLVYVPCAVQDVTHDNEVALVRFDFEER
jgi:hypothetical protein